MMAISRSEMLDIAKAIVTADRNVQYGEPEDTFAEIAAMWSVYLGRVVEPHDVCAMMVLFKTCRLKNNPCHDDSWIDVAGYAACGAEVASTAGE